NQLRNVIEGKHSNLLEQLAADALMSEFPPSTLVLLSDESILGGAVDQTVTLLRKAQRRFADDFWINTSLAWSLARRVSPEWDEIIRFFTAAVVLRPHSPGARFNLGWAFEKRERLDEAIAEYREAIRLKPNYAQAHSALGNVLAEK